MLQIAADETDGYLIKADYESMIAIRDGIDQALRSGSWEAACLSEKGVLPIQIKIGDTPEAK